MLNKDPTKRVELIEFVQSEYNIIEDEDFEKLYDKTVIEWEASRERIKKEEELKE